jgi:hypothetical protein
MSYTRKSSASQINMYNACPFKWYLRYKKGIKEPPSLPLVKGSMLHSIIEEFYKLDPKNCGITLRNYKVEFPNYSMQVFDKVLTMPRTYFGKSIPTYDEELRSLCKDDFEYAKEIIDVKNIVRNYMQLFLMQFEQYARKSEYFNIAWYTARIKFSELELNTDNFQGFADSIIEKDGRLIINDWKTSGYYKLGYSDEYYTQLKLYAGIYGKLHGDIPDYGCITFVRYGIQCLYPIDKDTIVEEADRIISEFMYKTESDDENDYKRNYDYQFCTCMKSKNKDKNWCFYQSICNEVILNENEEYNDN